jgi:formate-dependent nitrite reductase membrane component NrfD
MVLSLVHLVLYVFTGIGETDGGGTILSLVAVAGIVFAVGTMAYTGILLGASKGIPFWRSGAVPVVFVISAVVTGHFTIALGMVLWGQGAVAADSFRMMAAEAAALVVIEVLAIFFFLYEAYKLPDPRESAQRILKNRMFVVGYFALGLGLPLVLMLLLALGMADADTSTILGVVAVGSVLGLVGGLILRQAVLVSGALPTLNIAGFEFRRISRPKDAKPGIGLLPPS